MKALRNLLLLLCIFIISCDSNKDFEKFGNTDFKEFNINYSFRSNFSNTIGYFDNSVSPHNIKSSESLEGYVVAIPKYDFYVLYYTTIYSYFTYVGENQNQELSFELVGNKISGGNKKVVKTVPLKKNTNYIALVTADSAGIKTKSGVSIKEFRIRFKTKSYYRSFVFFENPQGDLYGRFMTFSLRDLNIIEIPENKLSALKQKLDENIKDPIKIINDL